MTTSRRTKLLSARWNSPSPTGWSCRSCSRILTTTGVAVEASTAHAALLVDILDILHSASPPTADTAVPLWTLQLSPSELKVLRYLPTNMSRPEIAGELSVSANTVSTHIRNIYAKLGADDRSGAVRRARQLRLLLTQA